MTRRTCLALCVGVALSVPVRAQWTPVGDGIDYAEFTTAGPNRLFVSRLTRSNPNAIIDTTIANNAMSGSREVMSSQASRFDDSLSWWGGSWGPRNDVVVAINGGFFNLTTGVIDGGQIQGGWYAHWFNDRGAFSGFSWKTDRTAFHGECIDHTPSTVYIRFPATGVNQTIDGINITPANNQLIIFTPQYSPQTPSGTRTEVLVEMSRPNITTSGGGYTTGTIRSIQQNTGSTYIPFDHVVLSGTGTDSTTLINNATVGATVRIYQELIESNKPDVQGQTACSVNTGVDWSNVFATINSNYFFLENGVVRVPDAVARPGYLGYVNLNPRTAICWNAEYVFFVICDGRSAQSIGMSCETLGNWSKDVLGATHGVNLDGGGSSEIIVNGAIKNVPSDGNERTVMNGVVMCNVMPKLQSGLFATGQAVYATSNVNIRLGPGTNYGSRGTVSANAQGTVVSHAINGVYAKGFYWWKCTFGGTTGWVAEAFLASSLGNQPPAITQHPTNQNVASGGTATFSVAATGTPTLAYQWQKNQADLSNGGHYSGVTTPVLTVSLANSADAANYRCVVTNAYGQATSNEAALVVTLCSSPVVLNGSFEAGQTGGVGTGWTGYQRAPLPATSWSLQTAAPPGGGGAQYQQIANTSSTGGAGVYQVVTNCTPGSTYTVSGWMRTNSTSAVCTVKATPSASSDYATAIHLNPPQTTTSSTWVPFSGTVVAADTSITVWLDGQTGGTGLNKASCFDAVAVTGCTVSGGPPIPGDFNGDGDVDQEDFAHLQNCFDPSTVALWRSECVDANLDGSSNGLIDQLDFAVFSNCMSGPNVPALANCAN